VRTPSHTAARFARRGAGQAGFIVAPNPSPFTQKANEQQKLKI
jgi:hypothetical protein